MLLVTGGAGFIGSNFVLSTIAETGEAIVNLDNLTHAGNLHNLDALRGDARHVFVQETSAIRSSLRACREALSVISYGYALIAGDRRSDPLAIEVPTQVREDATVR